MSAEPAPSRIVEISWSQLHQVVRSLAQRLRRLGPWRGIVAVARGGLIPAAILAEELALPFVDTVCISSYEGTARRPPRLLKTIEGPGAGLLVIDDILDSGATVGLVRAMLPAAHIAAVYAKPAGRAFADSVAVDIGQECWVRFPWETGPP